MIAEYSTRFECKSSNNIVKELENIQNENLKSINGNYSKCRPMSNNHAYKIEKWIEYRSDEINLRQKLEERRN
jgi:hypothetical protein